MSELRAAAEQYLQLRSELGYKMHRVTRMLRSFVAFAEQEGAADITTDLALRWAQQPSGAQPTTWAWRLSVVRRFASWLSASDHHTQVPPPGPLPERYRRKRPYNHGNPGVPWVHVTFRQRCSGRKVCHHEESLLDAGTLVAGPGTLHCCACRGHRSEKPGGHPIEDPR